MLGVQIRGINHLYKLACDAQNALTVINIKSSQASECLIYPMTEKNSVVVINKRTRCDRGDSGYLMSKVIDRIKPSYREHFTNAVEQLSPNLFTLTTCNPNTFQVRGSNFGSLTIAPSSSTFESDYETFCNTNKKVLSSVLGKYIDREDPIAKALYLICDGNANFMAWACKMVLRYGISIYAIKHFMEFDSEHKTLVKNLDKGNIVALSNTHEVVKSLTDIFHLRAQAVAKQTINWFNPTQKKLLREKLNDNEAIHILNNFNRLSSTKRTNFIRKVSTIDDVNEIIKMMSFLCSNTHFEWNKNSFLEFLENVSGLNYEVVHHNGNVIVLKVNDYETVKRLGKSTNWCITKNLQYWEQYMGNKVVSATSQKDENPIIIPEDFDESKVEDAEVYLKRFNINLSALQAKKMSKASAMQFMVFDFDQKEDSLYSIVGFTATPTKGVTHAHNFVNNNMMEDDMRVNNHHDHQINITFWTVKRDESKDDNELQTAIHSYLNKHNINVNELCKYHYTRCNWDKSDVMRAIKYLCHPDDIHILFEDDTKLIIRSYSDNIAMLLPSPFVYFNARDEYGFQNQVERGCVMYLDFSKPSNDINKILVWKIEEIIKTGIEVSNIWFNETGFRPTSQLFASLTDLFDHYGLPFDTIKRPNNIEFKVREYARLNQYNKVIELLDSIPQEKTKLFSTETLNEFGYLVVNMLESKDITFWDNLCSSRINLISFFGKEMFMKVIEDIFARIINESLSCDRMTSDNLYLECNSFSDFISLNCKSEKEWGDILNSDIPLSKKAKRANIYTKTHNINGYAVILDSIIQKLMKDGWDSIYNAIIPNLINYLYVSDIKHIDASRQKTLFVVVKHFIRDNLIYWRDLTCNDCSSVFKLLSIADYGAVGLSKLQSILKTDLKAKHISRLITDLDKYCGTNNSKYQQALTLICNAAKDSHAVSDSVVQEIKSSRVNKH